LQFKFLRMYVQRYVRTYVGRHEMNLLLLVELSKPIKTINILFKMLLGYLPIFAADVMTHK
jgi:hypothetical protein